MASIEINDLVGTLVVFGSEALMGETVGDLTKKLLITFHIPLASFNMV